MPTHTLQVLEMFILVLQQCHKESEDKWKRLSRQVADIILPMLAKQQVCLCHCCKGGGASKGWVLVTGLSLNHDRFTSHSSCHFGSWDKGVSIHLSVTRRLLLSPGLQLWNLRLRDVP